MPCNIDYDGEQPDFYTCKILISRKEHMCCECFNTIQKGSEYQHITGKWDGRILRYKTCMICAELREVLLDNQVYYSELWDNLGDCLEDLTVKDIDKLSVPAIAKLEKKLGYLFHDNDDEDEDKDEDD